jgi:hypothetical protein
MEMNKTTKWILGIIAGVILLAVIACAAVVVLNMWGGTGWMMGSRSGRLWDGRGIMPGQSMHGSWSGSFFSPIRMLAPALICLGLITLIIAGMVALVLNQQQKKGTVPAPVPPAPPAEAVQATSTIDATPADEQAEKTCSSCQHVISEDWKVCPYCGTPVAATTD